MTGASPAAIVTFNEAVSRFREVTKAAVVVSERNIGVYHTGRQNRALFLLAKLVAHDMSILAILGCCYSSPKGAAVLDHFSIAALARTVIDASLITMYISDPNLSRDAWNLRRYVLYLHDLTNRKRLLTAANSQDELFFSSYPGRKAAHVSKIRQFAKSLCLPDEAVADLTTGQKVFVDGARGAVREAGWDVRQFDYNQVYLSSYVHSYPVSFMRATQHHISFSDPSDFQVYFCGFAVGVAAFYTERVQHRMATFGEVGVGDPLGQVDD